MLTTEWGEALDREHPLPEYPRPQLRREGWLNLNGPWEYAFTRSGEEPEEYDGEIIVPFAPESALSGGGLSPLLRRYHAAAASRGGGKQPRRLRHG